ncbi:MAG: dihydroorotate dehydrogenase electron transfer subunit [Thiomicrorhabdus sp.]|nr:MAG: dihydroorotate dehydrogenase electron transfer subunit [Thiomicrorhabdus sp.]
MSALYALIEQFSQSEQVGGFWLINLKLPLTSELQNLFDIGCLFYFKGSPVPLILFQQTLSADHIQLQLLSQTPLSTEQQPVQINYCLPAEANITLGTKLLAPNMVILGSELAMASLFLLAKQRSDLIKISKASKESQNSQTIALLHSSSTFPFVVKPALFMAPDMPAEAIGCSTLLEDWQITNRLASDLGLAGCFEGQLIELLTCWMQQTALTRTQAEAQPWHVITCIQDPYIQEQCLQACEAFDWIQLTAVKYGCINQT